MSIIVDNISALDKKQLPKGMKVLKYINGSPIKGDFYYDLYEERWIQKPSWRFSISGVIIALLEPIEKEEK